MGKRWRCGRSAIGTAAMLCRLSCERRRIRSRPEIPDGLQRKEAYSEANRCDYWSTYHSGHCWKDRNESMIDDMMGQRSSILPDKSLDMPVMNSRIDDLV